MRYWWVNQNQTFRHEFAGGYLWSPKRRANGSNNPFYEFMREVAPGDLVFSFANTRIVAYGIASSYAYEAPKPLEFGDAGRNWSMIGWRVDVSFTDLGTQFRPKDWMAQLRPLLPTRYSPLTPEGNGLQSVYLTELPPPLARALADLISQDLGTLARLERTVERQRPHETPEIVLWEQHLEREIHRSTAIQETEKQALILARRGQGLFRDRVRELESSCRVTRVNRAEHLRASHCKPWRDCASSEERLDGDNGLMLTPSIDHLFDRGFISFRDNGQLLVSPVAHAESLRRMGVPVGTDTNVGEFRSGQRAYLEYHRDLVFLKARVTA